MFNWGYALIGFTINKPGRYPFIQYLLLKQVVNLLRKKSHY